jgi:transcriptional regulator with XRE-family HTH domain
MTHPVDPLLRTIGLTIRALRRERGLSQETLAELADIDRSYMSSIERGKRNVSVLNVARIAAALDVPVRDLFGLRELVRPPRGTVRIRRAPRVGVGADWTVGGYLSLS